MERRVKALVLSGYGINCEEETCAAFRLGGAESRIVHMKEIFSEKVSIFDFDILAFPGGFSYGDDLGAGRVLANHLKYKKMSKGERFFDHLLAYAEGGGHILGICNGFQVLVALGLLPGLHPDYEQQVSLVQNNSGKFEDRWVHCKVSPFATSPMLRGKENCFLPVRHAEGKLVVEDPVVKEQIIEKNLVCMQYCDAQGRVTDAYPHNPNGSFLSAAALQSPNGRVLGMMPHPEAFLSLYNHPNWGQILRQNSQVSIEGEGLRLFKQLLEWKGHDQKSVNQCIR